MKQKKYTQTQQVIDALRKCGGYSTLGNLYHFVDTSSWGTETTNNRYHGFSNRFFSLLIRNTVTFIAIACWKYKNFK